MLDVLYRAPKYMNIEDLLLAQRKEVQEEGKTGKCTTR